MKQWAWQDDAACHDLGLPMFFDSDELRGPAKNRAERAAKKVCASCPVRNECLDYALTAREHFGVWGGHTAYERMRLLRAPRPRPAELSSARSSRG